MGRVAWTRLSGDEVEEVVAILLSREHPSAERIRPSKGDGGIDILLPLQDGTFRVFQVKKFAENLKSSEKRQIKKSYNRLTEYLAEREMRVSHWSLVTPLDRTNENRGWLKAITSDAEFEVDWLGLSYVDGLTAAYPNVIDYYLKDGRDRLEAAVASLTSLLRTHANLKDTTGPYQAADAVTSLRAIHEEINRYDPHYRFDFSVDSATADIAQSETPGLVCTVQEQYGESRVTIRVVAKFKDAVHARPIPLSFKVRAEEGSELEAALEEFASFGAPLTIPPENVEVSLDLPGGLGLLDEPGELSILTPRPDVAALQELQFAILDPSGDVLAETDVAMNMGTRGSVGADVYGNEEGGVFEITLRVVFPNQLSRMNVRPKNFTGKKLEAVLPGLRFLAHCRSPNSLRIIDPYSGKQAALAPLGAAMPGDAEFVHKCVEDLITLQLSTGRRIPTPDFTKVTVGQALDWSRAARLTQGEKVEIRWNDIEVSIVPGHERELTEQFPGALLLRYPLTVTVSGDDYNLGICQFWTPAAQVKMHDGEPVIENGKAIVEPMDGTTGTLRLLGQLSAISEGN